MTICRKCGTSNHDGRKFCVFCHELLVADPVEMEKRKADLQKKQQKMLKKSKAAQRRQKNALFMLIPIGILDLLNLFMCLDIAIIGISKALAGLLGERLVLLIGDKIRLFGNQVYTEDTVLYVLLVLELLAAVVLLLVACVLSVIMIVRMFKWRAYCMRSKLSLQAEQGVQAPAAQESDTEEVKMQSTEQVSYAVLAQAYEQREQYVMPAPASEINLSELYRELCTHLWEYDEDSVRRILSAMSASRLLICDAGALDRAGIFDQLSHAFGVNAQQLTYSEEQSDQATQFSRLLLQRGEQTEHPTHTPFVKALYTARFSPKNICLAGVSGVRAADTEAFFAPVQAYYRLPQSTLSLDLGVPCAQGGACPADLADHKMALSSNVWTLHVLPENDQLADVGARMRQYGAAVYVNRSKNVVAPEASEQAQAILPSVEALERAIATAENDYYVSDEMWAVIDLIEQKMLDAGGARISNRTLRMFEKYTAVFMACAGKQTEAFDNGLAAIIIPACAEQLRAAADQEQTESLSAILDSTVGREKLPMTVGMLTSMGLLSA